MNRSCLPTQASLAFDYLAIMGLSVTDSPRMPQDPAIQVLQECAHQIAEEERAQQAEEQAEDSAIIGRLVSATSPSEFRAATGAPP